MFDARLKLISVAIPAASAVPLTARKFPARLAVACALLVAAGCAGPAWWAGGESKPLVQRTSTARRAESKPVTFDESAGPAASPHGEPSLSQLLDDLQRIKHRSPSDFAVIQSAVEDTSNLFPPPYQQIYKDQMLGMALQQQGQFEQQPLGSSAAPYPHPLQGLVGQAPVALPSPQPAAATQVPPPTSLPVAVTPASHAIDAAAAPVIANVPAAPTAIATTHVGDARSSHEASAAKANVAGPATALQSTAMETGNRSARAEEVETEPGQWHREIEQALTLLNADLARPNLSRDEKARLEIMRRLLYVATNQRDAAVAPIEQLDEDEREFWKHQIHGLLVSIDADGKHPTTRRAALALRNLRAAEDHLANVSTLDVRNLTFCREVLSYGEYRVFDSYSFRAKDEVVLYVEIQNFAAHPRGDSFETELHSWYEIIDDAGKRVANVVLPVDKQVSSNRRRDYFIAYLMTMPTQIAPGSYRLQLTVEDVIGKKSNHAAIDFRIQ